VTVTAAGHPAACWPHPSLQHVEKRGHTTQDYKKASSSLSKEWENCGWSLKEEALQSLIVRSYVARVAGIGVAQRLSCPSQMSPQGDFLPPLQILWGKLFFGAVLRQDTGTIGDNGIARNAQQSKKSVSTVSVGETWRSLAWRWVEFDCRLSLGPAHAAISWQIVTDNTSIKAGGGWRPVWQINYASTPRTPRVATVRDNMKAAAGRRQWNPNGR